MSEEYIQTNFSNGVVIVQLDNPPPAPTWADSNLDSRYWHINVGPFFDRFNGKAINITSSSDSVVQGLLTLVLPREYIDLKRPDLSVMMDILIAKSLITTQDKDYILNTHTTEYERFNKGLVQPE